MEKINLMDVKLNGVFIGTLKGVGSVYSLNGRMFVVGNEGFREISFVNL